MSILCQKFISLNTFKLLDTVDGSWRGAYHTTRQAALRNKVTLSSPDPQPRVSDKTPTGMSTSSMEDPAVHLGLIFAHCSTCHWLQGQVHDRHMNICRLRNQGMKMTFQQQANLLGIAYPALT